MAELMIKVDRLDSQPGTESPSRRSRRRSSTDPSSNSRFHGGIGSAGLPSPRKAA